MKLIRRGARRSVVGLLAGLLGLAAAAPSAGAELPTVNMDQVTVQSQVEPWLDRNTGLTGDASVRKVQRALRAKGFGTIVDGHFGDQTRADYAAWQRRLGHSGRGANGIPGPGSLTELGTNRFTVERKVLVGPRVSYSGVTLNRRTRKMLVEADSKVSWRLDAEKGSYVSGDCGTTSACTHGGGGAVDLEVNWSRNGECNLSHVERNRAWRTVEALRTVGFAAWLRTPSQGRWCFHIHAIAVGDTATTINAANQVGDYFVGKNALANHLPENTPVEFRVPFTWWERYLRRS